jgi:pyruvate/2-oxoglutarate dehydrogenase complex dihydrolipoamide dehydrogenase (E3) component
VCVRGCDPKKVLVGATEVIERSRQMAGKGVSSDSVKNRLAGADAV